MNEILAIVVTIRNLARLIDCEPWEIVEQLQGQLVSDEDAGDINAALEGRI